MQTIAEYHYLIISYSSLVDCLQQHHCHFTMTFVSKCSCIVSILFYSYFSLCTFY